MVKRRVVRLAPREWMALGISKRREGGDGEANERAGDGEWSFPANPVAQLAARIIVNPQTVLSL